ncbi:hypothetical protein [Rhodococcus sp. HNM0569]|uniref:DUF6891 domain-containing protein n=1 Tax=Rhodococcus sp. HNM0569 TaxID=2716340 RepID=UPI00146DDB5F|nr:hypothetical protein [Rhodococcus sp. HNM0569]NLU83634.1 hypothetical protein [Rhodococcus sp. HNM0569]
MIPEQKLVDEARERAVQLVMPGFTTFDDVHASVAEVFVDASRDEALRHAYPIALGVWDAKLATEAAHVGQGDYDRLVAAFDALDERGIVTRMNFSCCATCSFEEIDDERTPAQPDEYGYPWKHWGYAYFHGQDTQGVASRPGSLWLAFGAFVPRREFDAAAYDTARAGSHEANDRVWALAEEAAGRLVVEALEAQGLRVEWSGSRRDRISVVDLDWRKHVPR